MARQAGLGALRTGPSRYGTERLGRQGRTRTGRKVAVGTGGALLGRHGMARTERTGREWIGLAGLVRRRRDRTGQERLGAARQARLVGAWRGTVWSGKDRLGC
jgi:hypothetical protein